MVEIESLAEGEQFPLLFCYYFVVLLYSLFISHYVHLTLTIVLYVF